MEDFPIKGPLINVGVDIVSVARIRGMLERQGTRFLERVYTQAERDYCAKFKDPAERYAARFAAKEAVAKAFTTGIGEELEWRSIGVVIGKRGQPQIELDKKAAALLWRVGGDHVVISLSHTADTAIAFAAIVG